MSDVLDQIKAKNQKTVHVVEAAGVLYAAQDPKDLPEGKEPPMPFVLRRVNVSEVTRQTYEYVLGQDQLVQLASLNASKAGEAVQALDKSPARPPDPEEEADLVEQGFVAQYAARRQVLRHGLVSPTYEELNEQTEFYDELLYQCVVLFSQPGAEFPKVGRLAQGSGAGLSGMR